MDFEELERKAYAIKTRHRIGLLLQSGPHPLMGCLLHELSPEPMMRDGLRYTLRSQTI